MIHILKGISWDFVITTSVIVFSSIAFFSIVKVRKNSKNEASFKTENPYWNNEKISLESQESNLNFINYDIQKFSLILNEAKLVSHKSIESVWEILDANNCQKQSTQLFNCRN